MTRSDLLLGCIAIAGYLMVGLTSMLDFFWFIR